MAMTNQYMESAANTMYELSADRMVREQCRRRAEYELYQKYQAEENARKDAVIADQKAELEKKDMVIAYKDAVIADKDAVIADLKRRLAESQGKV